MSGGGQQAAPMCCWHMYPHLDAGHLLPVELHKELQGQFLPSVFILLVQGPRAE